MLAVAHRVAALTTPSQSDVGQTDLAKKLIESDGVGPDGKIVGENNVRKKPQKPKPERRRKFSASAAAPLRGCDRNGGVPIQLPQLGSERQ